jgi:hypothetical protein
MVVVAAAAASSRNDMWPTCRCRYTTWNNEVVLSYIAGAHWSQRRQCSGAEEVESGALSRRRGRRGGGLLIVVLHQMTMWRTVEHHQGTPQPPRRRAQSPPTRRVVLRVVRGAAPVVRSCLPLWQPSRGAEQSRAPDTPAISSSTRRSLSAGGDR